MRWLSCWGAALPESFDTYVRRFTDFYVSLTEVYPDEFAPGARQRIGSTFKVPGAGGLDAQTFYMRHVLELVFADPAVISDLITLARYAFRGKPAPRDAVSRVKAANVMETLYAATEAASTLTGGIGYWDEGTDLFANILTNTDCALQMAGLYDHATLREERGTAKSATTMDQSSIDALFG